MPNTMNRIVFDLLLAGIDRGGMIGDCATVRSSLDSVGGGVYPTVSCGCDAGPSTSGAEKFSVFTSRWGGADSDEPSLRQKLILSSNSALHCGQTFINVASLISLGRISRPS